MKTRNEVLIVGLFGTVALGGVIAAGYWEHRIGPGTTGQAAIGKPVSERQLLERRRGRMAEPAIVATTMQ